MTSISEGLQQVSLGEAPMAAGPLLPGADIFSGLFASLAGESEAKDVDPTSEIHLPKAAALAGVSIITKTRAKGQIEKSDEEGGVDAEVDDCDLDALLPFLVSPQCEAPRPAPNVQVATIEASGPKGPRHDVAGAVSLPVEDGPADALASYVPAETQTRPGAVPGPERQESARLLGRSESSLPTGKPETAPDRQAFDRQALRSGLAMPLIERTGAADQRRPTAVINSTSSPIVDSRPLADAEPFSPDTARVARRQGKASTAVFDAVKPAATQAAAPASITVLPMVENGNPVSAPISADVTSPLELPGEAAIERELDLSRDSQWLDALARDIVESADGESPLRFRLNPETLGSLEVEVRQGPQGATVRMLVDNEAVRAMFEDAQPRLVAEARAQGVRIAEAQVDVAGNSAERDPRHQKNDGREPFVRIWKPINSATESDGPAARDAARYA